MSPSKSLMNSPKNNLKRTRDRFPHREGVGWLPYDAGYSIEEYIKSLLLVPEKECVVSAA